MNRHHALPHCLLVQRGRVLRAHARYGQTTALDFGDTAILAAMKQRRFSIQAEPTLISMEI